MALISRNVSPLDIEKMTLAQLNYWGARLQDLAKLEKNRGD